MQILGYVVYAIGVLLTITWLLGIRSYTARGTGTTKQTVNTTLLFVVSLVIVPVLSQSPLHLLWMFPVSLILGMLSLAFPFSLLSIPGQAIFEVACVGLNPEEVKRNTERVRKLQLTMIKEKISAAEAKAKLEERGEW